MAKWEINLSTTERNHVGLMKMRKGNSNTETIEAQITEKNKPYDLTGLDVFFNAYFDRFIPVEQRATIIDAKAGKIRYTLNKYDLHSGLKFAYFSLVKGKDEIGSTQNFAYQVLDDLYQSCADAETYIIRLEELLDGFASVKETSMAEIQKIIDDFKKNVIEQQENFDEWFKSVKEILESIDPGGVLLNEVIEARDGEKSLGDRLDRDKGLLEKEIDFIKNEHYLLKNGEISTARTLIDDDFSKNHTVIKVGETPDPKQDNPIVIGTVDDQKQNRFAFKKVGVI